LRSGDADYLREDDSFVFEARMGDVLRLAGFLVSPSEIEAHIERHPTVASAQVVVTSLHRRFFGSVLQGQGLRRADKERNADEDIQRERATSTLRPNFFILTNM
jgi:acyl-coenzyme A synthetase/AMP-(fatty) acid ligase